MPSFGQITHIVRKVIAIIAVLTLSFSAFAQEKGLFLITRNYRNRPVPEKVTLVIDYKELQKHNSVPVSGDFDITDGNFGKRLTKKLVDTDSDNQPDAVVIDYVFASDEPVFSFATKPNDKQITLTTASVTPDTRLKITYLKHKEEVANWPDKIIESAMTFDPNPQKFDAEIAFFLNAMYARCKETQNQAYLSFIKKWADRFIDSHGYIDPKYYNVAHYQLDVLMPGRVFVSLYEATKDVRYKGAAQQLRQQLQYQPRTADGGYWQHQTAPYQMWLEGAYMSGTFLMQYAKVFNEPQLYNQGMQQMDLVFEHNGDPETGLMYHGWDESGNRVWSNEDTGTSREFWSRGIGWYYMGILECIDILPVENMDRKVLGPRFRDLTKPVLKFQDQKTGLWYQVTNKSYEPRNWIETSGSAMLAFGFAKGFNKGILDKSYQAAAQKAFTSLQRDYIFFDDEDKLYFDGTAKSGTLNTSVSKGDLDYYVSIERRVNDYKGLAALLYLSMELD